jgi:Raf kinase inhibitor-like YbhB/YbcL family protein
MNNALKTTCRKACMTGIILCFCGFISNCQIKTMPAMIIESSAFRHNDLIPSKYTCDGSNISPALKWKDFPPETKSFVMINDDPDAPMGTWIHWVLFNIPASVTELQENFSYSGRSEKQILAGTNSFRRLEYGGPCPPSGTHRYFFKIYALDTFLDLPEGASKSQIEKAMQGHVLGRGEVIGLYKRK